MLLSPFDNIKSNTMPSIILLAIIIDIWMAIYRFQSIRGL